MKIFYAVQATGNGHISRAMEVIPYLENYGEVDVFLSGANSTLELSMPVKYRSN
jgi:UDP-N-acetylglucosamine:LPS N-acetylglucosamine transferase